MKPSFFKLFMSTVYGIMQETGDKKTDEPLTFNSLWLQFLEKKHIKRKIEKNYGNKKFKAFKKKTGKHRRRL